MKDVLPCPRCQGLLLAFPGAAQQLCPDCGMRQAAWTGPAFGRDSSPRIGARAHDGDATCFFHASRKAERACDACGRFVCALCDLPFGQSHLCPTCLEEGRAPQAKLGAKRMRWDKLLLVASLVGSTFFWFISFISGPTLLFLALKHWRMPAQLPAGRAGARARLLLVVGLNLLVCLGWGWLLSLLLLKSLA